MARGPDRAFCGAVKTMKIFSEFFLFSRILLNLFTMKKFPYIKILSLFIILSLYFFVFPFYL